MNIPSIFSLKQTLISCLATALIVGGLSGVAGWKLRNSDYQSHLVKDAEEAQAWAEDMRKLEGKAREVNEAAKAVLEAKKQEVRETTRKLTERIPDYVSKKSDAACTIPRGLVELHNQATARKPAPVSTSTSVDRDAPSTVTLSTLTEVNIHNIGVAKELEAEVLTWRSWYQEQAKVWNGIADPSSSESDTKSGDMPFTPISIIEQDGSPGAQTSLVPEMSSEGLDGS